LSAALGSVVFQIPNADDVLVKERILNPQVLSKCTIEKVVPTRKLYVKRVGRYVVQLKVGCKDSVFKRTVNVEVNVDARSKVYISIGRIEKGEPLKDKVEINEILLSSVRGKPFRGDIKKVVARITIPEGSVILERYVEIPFLVKKGKLVRIIAQKGNIFVETKGRALQNGRKGDIIRVKNIYSGKIIEGKVKDENTIVVDF